jgi:uncharacterized protein
VLHYRSKHAKATAVPALRSTLSALALVVYAATARAEIVPNDQLYQARAFVTGEGEAERARGFALCLEEVLVKLSGDPRLRDDRRVAPLEEEAGRLVASFHYHDRMSGIPVHDEQGTRERPFDLFVSFDHSAVDAALRSLGRKPWLEPRPRVVVLLGIKDAQTSYVLASDGERGLGQRQALAAAAEKRAFAAQLPSTAALAANGLTYDHLDAAAPEVGGDVVLIGRLVWTEAALGWKAEWRFPWQGQEHRWDITGVSFDDAFRDAVDHALLILSPNAAP